MRDLFAMNCGPLDRALRLAAGLLLLSLVFLGPQTPWGYLGFLPLITGAIGWCPLYVPFGVNTT